jgi:hypothetical protein
MVLREDIEHLSMLLHRSPQIVMKLFKEIPLISYGDE